MNHISITRGVLVAAVVGAFVNGGCAQSLPGGAGGAGECSSDTDCKGERVCEDGACVEPSNASTGKGASSSGTGESCHPSSESCADGNACCEGSTCVDYGSTGTLCGAQCNVGADCASTCCTPLLNEDNVCAPQADWCGYGASCNSSANCNTGFCSGLHGWCTHSCTNSLQCTGNTWCVSATEGGEECFMGCNSNSDCASYPGSTCHASHDVDGSAINICSF